MRAPGKAPKAASAARRSASVSSVAYDRTTSPYARVKASRSSRSYCKTPARRRAIRREFVHRFRVRKPVEGLARYGGIDARIGQSGLGRGPVAPFYAVVRLRGLAHRAIRFDRDHVRAALGEEPRRNAGTGTDIGNRERMRIAKAREGCIDGSRRIGRPECGVGFGTRSESLRRVHAVNGAPKRMSSD